MQDLRFLYEQWSQIEVGIEKVGKILSCLKFGTADGPRVRGGQSAVHESCSPEALQSCSQQQNYTADGPPMDHGRSAKGPRTVRLSSVHSASFGYTDGLSTEQYADGPPRVRGQSALGVFRGILTARLIMSYKGISLVDHIHLRCIWDVWIGYICSCCLLQDDWMD